MLSCKLQRIVSGEFKHARQQKRRDRANRLGLRRKNFRVVDEFPDDLGARVESAEDDDAKVKKLSPLDGLKQKLLELAKRQEYLELLNRVLLNGDQIGVVADELGINCSTARSILARAKRVLKFPFRKKDDQ